MAGGDRRQGPGSGGGDALSGAWWLARGAVGLAVVVTAVAMAWAQGEEATWPSAPRLAPAVYGTVALGPSARSESGAATVRPASTTASAPSAAPATPRPTATCTATSIVPYDSASLPGPSVMPPLPSRSPVPAVGYLPPLRPVQGAPAATPTAAAVAVAALPSQTGEGPAVLLPVPSVEAVVPAPTQQPATAVPPEPTPASSPVPTQAPPPASQPPAPQPPAPTPTPVPSPVVQAPAPVSQLVITGIDAKFEVITVTNRGTAAQNMAGWKLYSGPPPVGRVLTYEFPADFTLGAGKSVNLYSIKGANSSTDLYWGFGSLNAARNVWGKKGDAGTLVDNLGKTVHVYTY